MNALQLSLTSYGFTQEQVGMQMNTLQRRVTALKQALINLTTSTNGSVSTVLKGLVNALVSLLQHLNNIPVQQLGFTILMNVIALKGPVIINILNRMKNSVLGVGQAFSSLSKMGKANVFVAVATVIYDACSALGMFDVSVPLRGLWFLSYFVAERKSYGCRVVSVPLRGLWFLSKSSGMPNVAGIFNSFRPLAGIMVLIKEKHLHYRRRRITGFRPLAGIMVLIAIHSMWCSSNIGWSFRPLAGIMVLILSDKEMNDYEMEYVSVPLRGLWFLSLCPRHC